MGGREIWVAEIGSGPPLLMLHGGGPGAAGVANFERNLDALAERFRLIVPDMPGYGRSTKGLDRKDPFGDLAGAMLGLLDALGVTRAHALGNSLGGACALRMALDAPQRIDRLVLLGPGGVDTTRSLPTTGLKHLLDYYSGDGPTRDKLATFLRQDLVFDGAAIPDTLIDARFEASIDPEIVAKPPLVRPKGLPKFRAIDFTRDPRLCQAADADTGALGHRGPRQSRQRRPFAATAHAQLRSLPLQPHRSLGAVGARRRIQRSDDRLSFAIHRDAE